MSRPERPPLTALALAALAGCLLALPLAGLLWRAPWSDLPRELTSDEARDALRLSLVTSLAATALSLVLGLPLAWVLARVPFPGRSLVRALAVAPLVLPPVVGGMALLLALGRRGLVGRWLEDAFGLRLAFTTGGAALAEAFVAMPVLVLLCEAAFRSVDPRLEDAARSLGAGRATVFRRVTLPLVAPSVAAGAVLCWARALGEFGATVTFNGSFPGRTETLPLAVYALVQRGRLASAIGLSLVLLAVSVAVLAGLRHRWPDRPT